uniref:EB domain-containing protein n=1 Tax=Apis cerana TaxID=7461 RepID=V9IA08_APICE
MSALPSALRLTCCRSWLLLICLLCLVSGCTCRGTRPDRLTRQLPADDDVRVSNYDDDDVDEDYQDNATAKGQQLGSPCDVSCNPKLQHVFCDTVTGFCECEKFYPVRLGPSKGCAKHLVLITTDIPTLLCIASGIAVFTAMICFVLKLFSRARYSRPRHYANANHAPPMLFSSDTGIPLTLHGGRPSSRSSQRSSTGGPLTYAFSRRPSSGGSRGPLVPSSRAGAARAAAILLISCHLQATKGGNKHRRTLSDVAEGSSDGLGSRRPSLTSVHSSTSSARSYSARRLEKERNEKEQRQALQELRLAKQREQQQREQQQQIAPTPSPRTPHSMDELLPSVEEGKEVFYNEQVPTTSDMIEETSMKTTAVTTTNINASRFGEMAPVTTSTTSIFETNIAPRATGDIFQV